MIKTLFVAIVGMILALLALDYALSMPAVMVSYSTQECVSVDNYPGLVFHKETWSCENMPAKYDHVWVK